MPDDLESTRGPSTLDVHVNAEAAPEAPRDLLVRAVTRAFEESGGGDGEISVTLLADPDMREMNRMYLGLDRPTDVIAFSLGDEGRVLGDVYIGIDQAHRQAEEHGIEVAEELARLAIHGTLHVMGHQHPEGDERTRSPMFSLQERILGDLLRRRQTR